MESPSTDGALPHAVTLDHPALRDLQSLGTGVAGVPRGKGQSEALVTFGADRARVLAELDRLPVTSLLILESVLDAGGTLLWDDVFAEVKRRSRGGAEEIERAAWRVVESGFAAFFERVGYHRTRVLSLLHETAVHLDVVRGISLPKPPAGSPPPVSSEEYVATRDIVALATLVAHRPLRANVNGELNLTTVKTMAKAVKLRPEELDGKLQRALDAGLLARREGAVEPRARALLSLDDARLTAATGRRLAPYVGPTWLSLEEIARREMAEFGGIRGTAASLLPYARDYATVEHAGVVFVAEKAGRARPVAGDGHVTPKMEVLLGPDAHPSVTAGVGLAAELVKLDRVLTFRLSAATIGRGLSLGLTAGEIMAALDKVGPRPAPDNVRANVTDIAARSARVTRSVVARCRPENAASVRALLARIQFEEPAPGFFVVASHDDATLIDAISRAGLAHYEVTTEPRDAFTLPAAKARAASASPDSVSPDRARFVARVDAALATKFRAERAAPAPQTPNRAPVGGAGSAPPATMKPIASSWTPTDHGPRALRTLERVDAWTRRLHGANQRYVRKDIEANGILEDLLLLADDEIGRALGASRSLQDLQHWLLDHIGVEALDERMIALQVFHAPAVGALRRADRATLASNLRARCAEENTAMYIEARTADGIRVLSLALERVMARGKDVVALAMDLETRASLSIRLDDILAAVPMNSIPLPVVPPAARPYAAPQADTPPLGPKPGRNDPCFCGSGKKYKRCHGL